MEPIDNWLDDALVQVAPKEGPRGLPGSGMYYHPTEDAFTHPDHLEVPLRIGDELTSAPSLDAGIPTDAFFADTPFASAEQSTAFHSFMNMASAAERMPDKDNVTLPHHYARFNIEPVRFICENNLNFFQANIVKYILRWDAKNGLEDLRKAKRYLEMFIKFVQKDEDWWRAA